MELLQPNHILSGLSLFSFKPSMITNIQLENYLFSSLWSEYEIYQQRLHSHHMILEQQSQQQSQSQASSLNTFSVTPRPMINPHIKNQIYVFQELLQLEISLANQIQQQKELQGDEITHIIFEREFVKILQSCDEKQIRTTWNIQQHNNNNTK